MGKRLGVSKHMYSLDSSSLKSLNTALTNATEIQYTLQDITNALKQLAIQAQWNGGPTVPFQSPLKRKDSAWKGWKGNIKLRNYLFIVASLPTLGKELSEFVSSKSVSAGNDLHDGLDMLKEELLQEDLWMDLLKERIAMSWVNIGPDFITASRVPNDNVIESFTGAIMKQFGGAIMNSSFLTSNQFPSLMKLIKADYLDATLVKQTLMSKRAFLESFDKLYASNPLQGYTAMFSCEKLLDHKPSTLNQFSLSISHINNESFNIRDSSLFTAIGYTKTKFNLNDEPDFKCVPTTSWDGILEFSLLSQCTNINECYVVFSLDSSEGGTHNFVFCNILPNFVYLYSIEDSDVFYFGPQSSIESNGSPINEEYIASVEELVKESETWFSYEEFPLFMKEFLQNGVILSSHSSIVSKSCLGLLNINECKLLATPKSKKKKSVNQPHQKRKANPTDLIVDAYATLENLYLGFEYYYNCTLFQKYSIFEFVSIIIPNLYEQLVQLSESDSKKADPIENLISFYTGKLIVGMPALEAKHLNWNTAFSYLINSDGQLKNAANEMESFTSSWFLRKKHLNDQKEKKVDHKTLYRQSLKELKQTECKLQCIIWLECLRIHSESKLPIPDCKLFKISKKKSRKETMKAHFEMAVEELMDKLLIWSVNFEDNSSNQIWYDFIMPIVVVFYQDSLPEIVEKLKIKTGGDSTVQLNSPIVKKRKSTKTKFAKENLVMPATLHVKKSSSTIAQLARRQIATHKTKSKRKNIKRSISSDDVLSQTLTLDDFLNHSQSSQPESFSMASQEEQKPSTVHILDQNHSVRQPIFIPETPAKMTNASFDLQSPPMQSPGFLSPVRSRKKVSIDLIEPLYSPTRKVRPRNLQSRFLQCTPTKKSSSSMFSENFIPATPK
ncbi:hypothetical protein HDV02_004754 [Globomyces sp. JEL0801]|nr:hypothetical protein HDV02_004754 [Globomyces sp. JEL0801]